MSDPGTLKGLLETATSLITEGRLAEAGETLEQIATDPGRDCLGPVTALGDPRRLHSARLRLAKARGDAAAKITLQYHLIPPPEVLAPLFPVEAEDLKARVAAAAAAVPKVLHQIWIGSAPPETTAIWRAQAERHGWAYRLWGEAEIEALGLHRDPVYRHMLDRGDLAGAVDVARYWVLEREGGLYLDCDWLPGRDVPFEDVFPMVGLSAMAETTPRLTGTGSPFLNNSVIAAPPGHPVVRQLREKLPEVIDRLPKGPAWWVTGPLVFTIAARAGPVTVLDATLDGGTVSGDQQAAEAEVAAKREAGDTAFLYGWKPWSSD